MGAGAAAVLLAAALVTGCGSEGTSSTPHAVLAAAARTPAAMAPRECQARRSLSIRIRNDFRRTDTNGNGMISATEATKSIMADFKAMDVNDDGVITLKDLKLSIPKGSSKPTGSISHYLPYDTNGDGRIKEAEYVGAIRTRVFRPMDRNHDGQISLSEALEYNLRSIGAGCK